MNGTGLCGLWRTRRARGRLVECPAGPAPPGAASRVGCDVRDNRPPTLQRTVLNRTLRTTLQL